MEEFTRGVWDGMIRDWYLYSFEVAGGDDREEDEELIELDTGVITMQEDDEEVC